VTYSDGMVRLALHAMATRFELVLHGADPARLRAAGEQALATIERLERVLSFYRADSDVALLNRRAALEPVRVGADTYRLLRACAAISAEADGAFDVTVGPLMRAWARARTGMRLLAFDDERRAVRFLASGVEVDLGAVGKGYAVDAAITDLKEAGIASALLHGGTSSVHAIGAPAGADAWAVEWGASAGPAGRRVIRLRDGALSVSAVHGKSFVQDGRQYGHVLDPRTGMPVDRQAALVTGPCSYLCDALSTALLVNGPDWASTLSERWTGYEGSLVAGP
jgi:thiamine biosynthesis lipoprotein